MTGPDDAPARPGRSSLVLPGVTGFVGALGVTVGAALPGSPFTVQAAGAWFFADPTRPGVVDVGTRFAGIVLVYVGIAVLLASWYEVWCAVRVRPGSPTGPLVAILMAWELPVAVGLPLFSRDVYSYAAQGEMVTRGISPYTHGPDALGGGRFLSMVDPLWRHSPAPYGPAWERLSGWVVAASGHDVRGAVLGFRLLSLVGLVLIALAVPVLADAAGRDRSTAFALAVLNPLVVLVLVGGAHNDGLMLGLLLAGSALALRGHVVSGV
ncbi:MAG: polyprenol phosphomannose-dependent alpha 1,6 mannosyltransferase MptB, partial [Acidimicrobiales bacterium]